MDRLAELISYQCTVTETDCYTVLLALELNIIGELGQARIVKLGRYLALKKDTAIEPEESQLILQSLFSRADTGLLKDDSSPTITHVRQKTFRNQ